MMDETLPFLNVREAAELLRMHVQSVRAAIGRGEIPAIRIGRQYRLSREALLRLGLSPTNGGRKNHG
jgi:excisionase family DNA binding protein